MWPWWWQLVTSACRLRVARAVMLLLARQCAESPQKASLTAAAAHQQRTKTSKVHAVAHCLHDILGCARRVGTVRWLVLAGSKPRRRPARQLRIEAAFERGVAPRVGDARPVDAVVVSLAASIVAIARCYARTAGVAHTAI